MIHPSVCALGVPALGVALLLAACTSETASCADYLTCPPDDPPACSSFYGCPPSSSADPCKINLCGDAGVCEEVDLSKGALPVDPDSGLPIGRGCRK